MVTCVSDCIKGLYRGADLSKYYILLVPKSISIRMNRNIKLFLNVKAILLYINVCYVDVYSEWASAV